MSPDISAYSCMIIEQAKLHIRFSLLPINRETKNKSSAKFLKFLELFIDLNLENTFNNSSCETIKIHMVFKKMIHVSPLKVKILFMPSGGH